MTEQQEIVAVIPVREGSERIREKNFIPFSEGKSLLEIKIYALKDADCFDHIYVSSDSERARNLAEENGVEFLLRAEKMCQADVIWSNVVEHIMETIPGNPLVSWALTTSPMFCNHKGAVDKFLEVQGEYDSLVAVKKTKSFFLNGHGRGVNFNPGLWHPYSQQLEPWYEITGACYIGRKSDMQNWKYWFGINPFLFEIASAESVDIDSKDDFRYAQLLYAASRIQKQ